MCFALVVKMLLLKDETTGSACLSGAFYCRVSGWMSVNNLVLGLWFHTYGHKKRTPLSPKTFVNLKSNTMKNVAKICNYCYVCKFFMLFSCIFYTF